MNGIRINNDVLKAWDTPWTRRQIETHLIFGPISRHVPFVRVYAIAMAAALVWSVASERKVSADDIQLAALVAFSFFILRRMPRYHQAVLGWGLTKLGLAFLSIISMTLMTIMAAMKGPGRGAATAYFALGAIWFPLPEFFPSLTPRQSLITLCRIIATVAIGWVGMIQGYWP